MNKITIREKEINPIEIVNAVFNRKDWGKSYTILTCGSITVTCEMIEYNFRNNSATFRIDTKMIYKNKTYEYDSNVIFYVKEDNEVSFKRRLDNQILKAFTQRSRAFTKRGYSYFGIIRAITKDNFPTEYYWWSSITDELIIANGYAEELKEVNKIDNEYIQDNAKDFIINETVNKLNGYAEKFLDNKEMKILPKLKDYLKLKKKLKEA